MKTLYLKGHKWLLYQNQRVKAAILGNIRYEGPFLKNIKVKGRQCPD